MHASFRIGAAAVGALLVLASAVPFGAAEGEFVVRSSPLPSSQDPASQAQQQGPPPEVVIRMIGEPGRLPRIAVPVFSAAGADADTRTAVNTVAEVLWNDLEFEQEFSMVSRDVSGKIAAAAPEALAWGTWKETGADFVLVGSATRNDTQMQVDVRIMSVSKQAPAFGKRYTCAFRSPRYCAHSIADDIHKEWFNLDGVARTKLAFVSDRDGERLGGTIEERQIKEVYISDYDGGNPQRVTVHRSLNISPTWSNDNRFIAYTSYTSGFPDVVVQSLYEARPATRPAKGTPQAQNYLPRISPDGTRIAFSSNRDGNWEIYTARIDGSDLRRLTANPGTDSAPCWSPNGAQIAFTSDRTGTNQIYVMSADGGPATKVTSEPKKADRPTWSPAPFNYIAYSAEVASSGPDIRLIELGTNVVRTLTDGLGTNESPSVSPTGRHIAFVTTRWGKEQVAIIGRDGKLKRQVTRTGNNRYPNWSNR
jgi:TolB protein